MYKYKLSIIIPAFNTGRELERTLNVLVCQTLNDYEIIVVNDNSTDETEIIVKKFQNKYNNIKYIKNNVNCGAGNSRNIGLKHSSGKFITFLDSDDWPDLITYETAVTILEENSNYSLAIWGVKTEYNNIQSSCIRNDYKSYFCINNHLALSMLCNTYSLDISISSYLGNKLFRKEFINNNKIKFNNIIFEDVEFSFKAIAYANEIILLPNIYTHYYQREHSIVHSFDERYIQDTFILLNSIKEFINNSKFLDYIDDYASLIEKCSKILFKLLYENIENPDKQKELVCLYFKSLFNLCTIEGIINYMDTSRLKKLLLDT